MSDQITFQVEHIRTGKLSEVTEVQFEKMQKLFPNTFRRSKNKVVADVSKYSDEAKKIITNANEEE